MIGNQIVKGKMLHTGKLPLMNGVGPSILLKRSKVTQQSQPLPPQPQSDHHHHNEKQHNIHDVEYQYMQQSKLPMLHFQASLPRLPIPKLEKTCERYLTSLRPLLIDESYRKTEDIVNRFCTKSGQQLQSLLQEKDLAHKETSYIAEPWFDMYLKDRIPLPINYNPLMMVFKDPKPEYNTQLLRSTNFIISSLRFMRSLRDEILEPEVFHLNPTKSDTDTFRRVTKLAPKSIATYVAYAFKAFPLDMSQYNGLFGATRIPEMDKDRIYRNDNSKHILIMRNGNFYVVNVLDETGHIQPPNVILDRMNYIFNDQTPTNPYPLGVLTAANRNDWARVRHHLIDIGNEKQMKLIDSALFCLCLDNTIYDEKNPVPVVKNFLSGDGSNRWFDKSVSLIIGKDGTAGINFEHSWGDGVAVLRFLNEIYNETINKPICHPEQLLKLTKEKVNIEKTASSAPKSVNLLEFNIDDSIKSSIKSVKDEHMKILNSLNISYLLYPEINRKFCKKVGVSPDSIIQLGFQLAFKKQYDKYVSTYESCSTAAFRHGRTETIRPCTQDTKIFCDSVLLSNRPSDKELRSLIRNCSETHGRLTKEAAMGQGFDRHLFGLKYIAELNGIKIPNLYADTSYDIMNQNIISTSTLSSPGIMIGAFGPVSKNGLGVGYTIQKNLCGAIVSSYDGHCNGKQFTQSLEESLNTIKRILETTGK